METIQTLRDLAEPGEPDPLKECVDLFLEDSPNCIEAIRSTLQASDAAGLKRAAHTLKGSSSNLGADQLASICGRLEEQAKTGNLAGADAILSEIEAEFSVVKRTLEELCASSQ
jgi:HPt (histidine-containing phosphotransfer) domain-containing protein